MLRNAMLDFPSSKRAVHIDESGDETLLSLHSAAATRFGLIQ
jgi:hypothetical protein